MGRAPGRSPGGDPAARDDEGRLVRQGAEGPHGRASVRPALAADLRRHLLSALRPRLADLPDGGRARRGRPGWGSWPTSPGPSSGPGADAWTSRSRTRRSSSDGSASRRTRACSCRRAGTARAPARREPFRRCPARVDPESRLRSVKDRVRRRPGLAREPRRLARGARRDAQAPRPVRRSLGRHGAAQGERGRARPRRTASTSRISKRPSRSHGLRLDAEVRFSAWHVGYRFARGGRAAAGATRRRGRSGPRRGRTVRLRPVP